MVGGGEVEATAPGKVILSGEHAVVHGYTAIAGSLELRSRCIIKRSSDEGVLSLDLSDLNLHLQWSLCDIKEALALMCRDPLRPQVASEADIDKLKGLVDSKSLPEAIIGVEAGITAFLYLYASILGVHPLIVTVVSELPLGSGLGSSASYCVSITAALLAMTKALKPYEHQMDGCSEHTILDLDEKKLDLINSWAFEGEKIIHGKPSGIDNTVSTYGYIVKFKNGHLSRIRETIPLKILLTNTRVGRNTKALVAGVGERVLRHPRAMTAVFVATEAIAEEVFSLLQAKSTSKSEEEASLEELVEMNQGLLQCMGVSHPSIEAICKVTSKYQLRSKLTGAGGGGCAFTVIPEQMSTKLLGKMKKDLEAQGFECFEAAVGGQGVQVLMR